MTATSPRAPILPPWVCSACVAVLLALHSWLGLSALVGKSATSDEPIHLTSGYSYWRFNDYRLQPENGNLPQRWAALPLLFQRPYLNPQEESLLWSNSHSWLVADHFFYHTGNSADFMLFTARAAMLTWSLVTALLAFFWSRQLWGDIAGLFTLGMFVVSPTMLANGPLVTSDMCAAFWLLAATGAWWRTTGNVTIKNLAISLLAAGLCFVAKFSAVLLIPIFAGLLLVRVGQADAIPYSVGTRRGAISLRGKRLTLLLGLCLLHAVAIVAVIWTFYGWRFTAFAAGLPPGWKFYLTWDVLLPGAGLFRWPTLIALQLHLLPESYLYGFNFVLHYSQSRSAFLLGDYRTTGWWWFFPYTFFAKSTLAELLLAILLAAAAARKLVFHGTAALRNWAHFAPLLILGGVYGLFSLTTKLNIGHRHILVLYPVLFILGGALFRNLASRWAPVAAALIVCASAGEMLGVRPDYLAFFNRAVGGPEQGWRQLVDSSLDWGQELPRTADWLRAHRRAGEPLFLSYFGNGDPAYEGIRGQPLSPIATWGKARLWYELQPGLYCLSATMLQEVYSSFHGGWNANREETYLTLLTQLRREITSGTRSSLIAEPLPGTLEPLDALDRLRFDRLALYLRTKRPEAVIGYSMFIYRLDAKEVKVITEGNARALADLMAKGKN